MDDLDREGRLRQAKHSDRVATGRASCSWRESHGSPRRPDHMKITWTAGPGPVLPAQRDRGDGRRFPRREAAAAELAVIAEEDSGRPAIGSPPRTSTGLAASSAKTPPMRSTVPSTPGGSGARSTHRTSSGLLHGAARGARSWRGRQKRPRSSSRRPGQRRAARRDADSGAGSMPQLAGPTTLGSREVRTFMFTDIVGSPRSSSDRGGPGTDLLLSHDAPFRRCVAGHAGEIVRRTGDRFSSWPSRTPPTLASPSG